MFKGKEEKVTDLERRKSISEEIKVTFINSIIGSIKTSTELKKIYANLRNTHVDLISILSKDDDENYSKTLASFMRDWLSGAMKSALTDSLSLAISESCNTEKDFELLIESFSVPGLALNGTDGFNFTKNRFNGNPELLVIRALQTMRVT